MKAKANWQLAIELNISFDDGLSLVTRDFVHRLVTNHPTVLVDEFTDDGTLLSVGPSQLESLLCRLQMVSTPLCRLSFAVRTVLVESSDYDDDDGIFDVGGDDSSDSFFVLSEDRPIVTNCGVPPSSVHRTAAIAVHSQENSSILSSN